MRRCSASFGRFLDFRRRLRDGAERAHDIAGAQERRRARHDAVADIETRSGTAVPLTIGMIAPDGLIGGTEILMAPPTADTLGITVVSRLVVWGFSSRAALDQALATTGVEPRDGVRVRRSWDAFDPDLTLGMAETKQALGEFTYRLLSDGINLTLSPDWAATNLPANFQEFVAAIPVRARCNNAIHDDLVAALTEVAQAGLGSAIDITNTNTYGGCFGPRLNRISGALGFISRHTWAQAIDMNTTQNAQGHVPRMNCDVVRIFRRHNFAWGGDFLTPDGMHFEWVGTRRDQYQYPSKYCPNLPPTGATQTQASATPGADAHMTRATMFAGDGFSAGD